MDTFCLNTPDNTSIRFQLYLLELRLFNNVSGNDPALSQLIYGGTASYRPPEGIQIRSWIDLPQFE